MNSPDIHPVDSPRASGDNPVAYEFYNPATGHAIVDYTRWTHAGHLTEKDGYVAKPLVYAPTGVDTARHGSDVHDESVSAPETRSALIQFAADVIRLRTNGEPLKVRESEALDSRLCDLGMAMRAEADRITAAIRGSVAAPVAAQPDLTALLREARDALEYHQEQTRPIVRTETAIARIDAHLGKGKEQSE